MWRDDRELKDPLIKTHIVLWTSLSVYVSRFESARRSREKAAAAAACLTLASAIASNTCFLFHRIPIQHNCYDCGVFVCFFEEYISRRSQLRFDRSCMPAIRSGMFADLQSGTADRALLRTRQLHSTTG